MKFGTLEGIVIARIS